MKLVFVHGRDQQGKDPIALRAEWETSLRRGLENAGLVMPAHSDVVLPYYGDVLATLIREAEAAPAATVRPRGALPTSQELEFRDRFYREIARSRGIPEGPMPASDFAGPAERGALNWGWVRSILAAIDSHSDFGADALDAFTHDVFAYLTVPHIRLRVNSIVARAIGGDPCVVVAHSLGTVVAFEVLRAARGLQVRRFVTVGSPLGVEAIKLKLDTPFVMPAGIGDWKNAMDERDVVALHPLDANHFAIDPPIENKTNVDNFTENRHGIAGYLGDADVARWIWEALAS